MDAEPPTRVMSCPLYGASRRAPACVAIVIATVDSLSAYVPGTFDPGSYSLQVGDHEIRLARTLMGLEGKKMRWMAVRDAFGPRIVRLVTRHHLVFNGASCFV